MAKTCREKAEIARKDAIYADATAKISSDSIEANQEAIKRFESILDWKDSRAKIDECNKKIEEIRIAEEKAEEERKRKEEERRIAAEKTKQKTKKIIAVAAPTVAVLVAFVILLNSVIFPAIKTKINNNEKYKEANELMVEGKYDEAINVFDSLNGYKDSQEKIEMCYQNQYNRANKLMAEEKYDEAINVFDSLNGYKDSQEKIEMCYQNQYNRANKLMAEEKYDEAFNVFDSLNGYKDSQEKKALCLSYIHMTYDAVFALIKRNNFEPKIEETNGLDKIYEMLHGWDLKISVDVDRTEAAQLLGIERIAQSSLNINEIQYYFEDSILTDIYLEIDDNKLIESNEDTARQTAQIFTQFSLDEIQCRRSQITTDGRNSKTYKKYTFELEEYGYAITCIWVKDYVSNSGFVDKISEVHIKMP